MSGRSPASSTAAISASSRCSGASSAAGATSTRSVSPSERRCVKVENQRSASTSSLNRSTRTAPVLGRRVEVEQAAADRELVAVLDLLYAPVAGGHEFEREPIEVEQVALGDAQPAWPQRRIGDLLGQGDRGDDYDRWPIAGGSSSASSAATRSPSRGRRRQVRLIGHAAAGIEAHGPRPQPGPQVGGEVARAPRSSPAMTIAGRATLGLSARPAPPLGARAGTGGECPPPSRAKAANCGSSGRTGGVGLRAYMRRRNDRATGRAALSHYLSLETAARASEAFVSGEHLSPLWRMP